nr:hypothetical protein [Tanacetum cinerariifolium]
MATSNNPYTFPVFNQDQPSFNQNYMQQSMPNLEDITDPTTAMNMTLALMAKAFKLNYSTPTNKNQRISSNPRNRQIAQPRNLNGYNDVQNVRNQVIQNAVQNPRIQNVGNQNGQTVVPRTNQNPNENGNLVAGRVEGNVTGYNGIQLQAEEFDLMDAATDLDEIKEVNANCILMANLQQASTSGTQTDKAPVYDSDGSAEVHNYEDCYDYEIFNMFTQEEQYTELLEPIPEPHQVPQNDNNVISEVTSVEQSGETVEQHPVNVKETQATKFVRDFKYLAKEADESLAKHKALELEIERLLRAVVSQDIMSVVQNNSVGETSNLQSEHERTKERFENCIIKKENEYAKLWNDWYKKCEECKFDKISYDKAYNDMQQKIERLQAQLGDLKVTSNSTPTPQGSNVMKNDMVIAPGMFRINSFKTSREEKHVPNKVRASLRAKPITVSQPPVITKKVMNSDSNGLSSIGVHNTTTRRPQPRSDTKNDRVPSTSKSSYSKNKGVEVEEH